MSATKSKSAPPAGASVFLDRIEEGLAVLVHGDAQIKVPKALLPAGAKEGEYLLLSLTRDPDTTKKMAEQVKEKRDALSADDDGDDIAL